MPKPSIESFGVGQSGYSAGRSEDDLALEKQLQTRNRTFPHGRESEDETEGGGLGLDERFVGKGGPAWAPEPESEEQPEPEPEREPEG